ncbi:hypothetical protein UA08_04892 [Talaromyces atroroseus]|uniref:Uracil permease n=1 Tax=Talaromyces atroroseus TaxID=1441469 RepID=A0A225B2D4_TALAT|nr:hypothetical protein UA08_04892 [Talaromyces atroroseus]OKL60007.1 hypothetical protein UA08_04892 [Talaromyces atroroseus]
MLRSLVDALAVAPTAEGASSFLINNDIRPLPPSRRSWGRLSYISFWAINQICLSNFQIGSSLVAIGLSVWQAVIAIILGKIIIALVAVSNGYVGATWHIGFPVWSRVVWGVYGSYVAIVQRIFLAIIWQATQAWTGGLCVTTVLSAIFSGFQHLENTFPESSNLTTKEFIGWVIYNVLTVPMLWVPPEKTNKSLAVMNVISFATLLSMMIWVLAKAHGGGPLLSEPATPMSSSRLGWSIVNGVTTVIGNIAVGLTNQPDYSRFARKPGDQVFGQWFSIIFFGILMPVFGCLTSSATLQIYGDAIWNPPDLALKWLDTDYNSKSRAAAFFAGVGLVICQLAINTVDNSFSAGMDLSGLFPRFINIRRGSYIGLIISIAICPWDLLASAGTFLSVMSAYSVFLGPMCGLMVAEYWVIRSRKVKLSDLYHAREGGIYYYWHGFNWRAFVAWVVGFTPQLPGFIASINTSVVVPAGCTDLYHLAFPLGFAISFVIYVALNKLAPPQGLGEYDDVDYYGTFDEQEARALGVAPLELVDEVDITQKNYTSETVQEKQ